MGRLFALVRGKGARLGTDSLEKQNVRLRLVHFVVLPAETLE